MPIDLFPSSILDISTHETCANFGMPQINLHCATQENCSIGEIDHTYTQAHHWTPENGPHQLRQFAPHQPFHHQPAPQDGASSKKSHALRSITSSDLNTPHMPGLQSRPSKLHLIDDTTLTSLPFPPPAASKRLKRASSTCSRFTNNPQSTIPERQSLLSFDLSKDALEESTFVDSVHSSRQDTSELHNTCTYIDEAHEDSLEDAQDPIVLVEDYVTEVQSQKAMFRKKSLANIKKRLREKSSRATFCPTFGASQPLKIDFGNNQRVQFPVPVIEDLEAIFGKIPGTERLKYCTICDKPLYEISSVLSCSNPKDTPQKSNMTQHYQEFVCSDCIVTYEQILNELHEAEMNYIEDGDCQSAGNQRFSQILANNSILNHFDTKDPRNHGHGCAVPHTQKRRKFSNDLISRLHHLSAVSQPEPQPQSQEKTSEWLSGWSEKLKWNFNSILTNAFPPSERAT